jgi:hypothetical protein
VKTAAIEGVPLSNIRDEVRQPPCTEHSGQFRLHRIADSMSALHRKSMEHQFMDVQ